MSWNWPRLRRTARRLLSRRHVALEETATEVVELAPGETVSIPPAVHTPESLERVQKLSPWRDWTTERLLIEGGRQQHAPCLRYRVRDAQLVGAYVYRGAVREEVGYARESWRAEGPAENLAEAHLMSNFAGSRFFGNYLLDEFPRQLLIEGPASCIRALGKHFEHEAGYRDLLGLERGLYLFTSGSWFEVWDHERWAQQAYPQAAALWDELYGFGSLRPAAGGEA